MSTSAQSPEMARFNDALRQAMQVSKTDLKRLLAQDKVTPLVPQKRGRKPKATTESSNDTSEPIDGIKDVEGTRSQIFMGGVRKPSGKR